MYAGNRPTSLIDTDGNAVVALTQLAQERIQSTVPKEVRSQVAAAFDKNGKLDRKAIDAIKNSDSNVKLLKQAVDLKQTIEVNTDSAVKSGQAGEALNVPFSYESVADQQAKLSAAGGDPSAITTPSVYDGITQTADMSPSGNIRVTVADGTGLTATEPADELASTTAHELYGHALPAAQGLPYGHDNGGPVDQNINKIADHTKKLNQPDTQQK
jgi:hypothetical protein